MGSRGASDGGPDVLPLYREPQFTFRFTVGGRPSGRPSSEQLEKGRERVRGEHAADDRHPVRISSLTNSNLDLGTAAQTAARIAA